MERWTSPDRERGQVLIIVASVMMLVLLGVAALTVDVGNALLQKRRLQNVADAAALAAASEIGRGSDEAAAALVAQNLVLTNTGNSVNPTYPASGGVNLTNGIEIDGGEVRVALRKTDVRTFFAGALGYQNLTVTARAHAGNNASAILPIAVKRYSAGQTTSSLTTQPSTPSTTDQLSRGGSLVLPDWPSPPWPALLTQSVGSYAADESNKGAVIPILGQEAIPNTDHPDFHYFIAPDVRNITHPQVEYYNGTSGSMTAQQLKNLESGYFLPSNLGYSSAKLPVQGDQIAVLNGVVTGQAVSLMKQYFPVKTTVSAIVYDGTVQSAPDFRLKITPDSNYSSMGGTITYTVALEQKSNPGLVNLSGVQFTLLGLDPTNNASWDFGGQGSTASVPVNGGNTSITLKITPAVVGSPGAPWQGAETFVVKAYDPLTQITRTAMAGAISGTSNVFYGASSYSGPNDSTYQKVEQNSNAGTFKFDVHGYNYSAGPNNVTDRGEVWTPIGGGATTSHTGVGISCGAASGVSNNNTKGMSCGVSTTASSETGEWMIQLTIGDGTSSRNQDVYLILRVVSNLSGIANTTDFVYVLGYANFQICYSDGSFTNQSPSHDSNTVFARAVSDITSSPVTLTMSRQARLYPW